MKGLVALLMDLGLEKVKTYIQSGNLIFTSKEKNTGKLRTQIASAIKNAYGFEPEILLLGIGDLEAAISRNPFPEAVPDPKSLHLGFLSSSPDNPDLKRLEALKKKNERFELVDKVFYLHAPEGVGASKLAANAERILGVSMTDRNWRTVCVIRELAKEI
jgi:uncharacterized protein (DUF1697 family)